MYSCPKCKSTHVQLQYWVRPNTGEIVERVGGCATMYCERCEESFADEEVVEERGVA